MSNLNEYSVIAGNGRVEQTLNQLSETFIETPESGANGTSDFTPSGALSPQDEIAYHRVIRTVGISQLVREMFIGEDPDFTQPINSVQWEAIDTGWLEDDFDPMLTALEWFTEVSEQGLHAFTWAVTLASGKRLIATPSAFYEEAWLAIMVDHSHKRLVWDAGFGSDFSIPTGALPW